MVSPAATRTSGFSNLPHDPHEGQDTRTTRTTRTQQKYTASFSTGSSNDATNTATQRRLRRVMDRVQQSLEPFYRAGRSGAIPTRGVPAAETIRAFVDQTTTTTRPLLALSDVRKCLFALGTAPDDTAFLLESLDRKRTGVMDRKQFIATFLPRAQGSKPTTSTTSTTTPGVRHRFRGHDHGTDDGSSDDNDDKTEHDRDRRQRGTDTNASATVNVEAFHRKVLERVRLTFPSVKDAFRQYDTARAGVLSVAQLRALLRDVGVAGGRDVDALVRALDHEQRNAISFHAFANCTPMAVTRGNGGGTDTYSKRSPKRTTGMAPLAGRPRPVHNDDDDDADSRDAIEAVRTQLRQRVLGRDKSIREVFLAFDADGNGHLDYHEFAQFMAAYGFSRDETQRTIAFVDCDGSGTIDYDEFASGLLFYHQPSGTATGTATAVTSLPRPRNEAERQRRHGAFLLDVVRETLAASGGGGSSPQGLRGLRDAFENFDADASGALDYREFAAFLDTLGVSLSPRDLDALMLVVDRDGSQQIEFDEFATVFGGGGGGGGGRDQPQQEQLVARMVRDYGSVEHAFRAFDRDGSGALDAAECTRLLRRCGVQDARTIQRLMAVLDADASGAVSLDEFLAYFRSPPTTKTKTTKLNDNATARQPQAQAPESAALRELKRVWVEEVCSRFGSLERAFHSFDRDGTDALDYETFRDLLGHCGVSDDRNVRALLRQVDVDNDGSVRLDEFLAVFGSVVSTTRKTTSKKPSQSPAKTQPKTQPQPKPQPKLQSKPQPQLQPQRQRQLEAQWVARALDAHGSVRAAFAHFDTDRSGVLDRDECTQLLAAFGITRHDDVATMLRRLDIDGSGTVEFDEFTALFRDVGGAVAVSTSPVHHTAKALAPLDRRTLAVTTASPHRRRALARTWVEHALRTFPSIDAAFRAFDRDGNGALDHDEFTRCMQRHGITHGDDIATLITRLDRDGNGTIDLHEFRSVFHEDLAPDDAAEAEADDREETLASVLAIERELAARMLRHTRDLREAFRAFDLNGNGQLEYHEFRRVLKRYQFPEHEIRQVIRHLDRDVSGCIDYREFINGLGSAVAESASIAGTRMSVSRSPIKKPRQPSRTTADDRNDRDGASPEALAQALRERMVATYGTMQSAFRTFDSARNGTLAPRQFETMARALGFSRDDARVLLQYVDADNSDSVEYDELLGKLLAQDGDRR